MIIWCPKCNGEANACVRCDGEGTVSEASLSVGEREALRLDDGPSARDEEREAEAFHGGEEPYGQREQYAAAARAKYGIEVCS
jgi:hypothetical protein